VKAISAPRPVDLARFWRNVDITPTCWLWTGNVAGSITKRGCMSFRGSQMYAHRLAYAWFVGPIPEGKQIDHRCRRPLCVRPSHLRPATNKQNHENHSGPRADNTSGVRGVIWDKRRRKWRAELMHWGRHVYVGRFDTIEAAAAAVREARCQLFTLNDADRIAA